MASAPSDLDRTERLAEQPCREGDADDRLEEHQDAGAQAADGPDPAQEAERRDGRREDAGEQQDGHDRGLLERPGRASPATPPRTAISVAPTTVTASTMAMACSVGTSR